MPSNSKAWVSTPSCLSQGLVEQIAQPSLKNPHLSWPMPIASLLWTRGFKLSLQITDNLAPYSFLEVCHKLHTKPFFQVSVKFPAFFIYRFLYHACLISVRPSLEGMRFIDS